MNHCSFLGRLTAEPILTHSSKDADLAICKYTIAVNRRFSKEDNKADFIRIVAFGKAGEFASKYFHKGQRVLIEGRLQIDQYLDKDDVKKYSAVIISENQEFADAPNINSSKQEEQENMTAGFTDFPEGVEDELPFN